MPLLEDPANHLPTVAEVDAVIAVRARPTAGGQGVALLVASTLLFVGAQRTFSDAPMTHIGLLVAVLACCGLAQFTMYTVWVLHNTFKFGWGPGQVGWSLFTVGVVSAISQGVLLIDVGISDDDPTGRLQDRTSDLDLREVGWQGNLVVAGRSGKEDKVALAWRRSHGAQ